MKQTIEYKNKICKHPWKVKRYSFDEIKSKGKDGFYPCLESGYKSIIKIQGIVFFIQFSVPILNNNTNKYRNSAKRYIFSRSSKITIEVEE